VLERVVSAATSTIFLDGKSLRLRPAELLAEGGEAEVYDLGDGTVVKRFKPPGHPDFAGDAAAQALVTSRLDEHQRKLRAFPANLPARVVTPRSLAFADKSERVVVGYRMTKVAGEPLHHLGEPRWRRDRAVPAAEVVAPLVELFDTVAALHQRGVVIGDFNDLNILVDGPRAHLIDADSYQFGGFRCAMFSERFLDPRLCQGALMPAQPHDVDSDWFAFHVMVMRTLLLVGPWGGVYQPRDPAARCPPSARPLRRISIFDPEVVLPRAALPAAALPDELRGSLAELFHGTRRGALPRRLLADLRFSLCGSCGLEHAHHRCPACTITVVVPVAANANAPIAPISPMRAGDLHVAPIDRAQLLAVLAAAAAPISTAAAAAAAATATARLWLEAEALWRRTPLGRERIGGILAGQTWAWANATLGAGFYRAGGYTVGFVFDPRRGVLDDRLRLPPLRGELVAAHATLTDERAWLWITLAHRGRLTTTAVVVDRRGAVLALVAELEASDVPWLAGISGACAAGPYLFVPTDGGLVRLELTPAPAASPASAASGLTITRTFPETAPLVCAADRLALAPGGGALDVLRAGDALRLTLS
jgi:tRNA A-37 threonylcarbamoyl transferase component Bud32